jgi:uncharacterized membrane protein
VIKAASSEFQFAGTRDVARPFCSGKEATMSNNPKVTAAVGGHPIHPMLIPFPVAFLVGTLASDLAFWGTRSAFWAQASLWLVGAGIVMALVAALAGFTDFLGEERIRDLNTAWYHMIGNLTVVVIAIVNLLLRYFQGADAAILPWGLVLSFVTVGTLLFTGWMGWDMVYRHRVGIADRGARAEVVSERPRRAA